MTLQPAQRSWPTRFGPVGAAAFALVVLCVGITVLLLSGDSDSGSEEVGLGAIAGPVALEVEATDLLTTSDVSADQALGSAYGSILGEMEAGQVERITASLVETFGGDEAGVELLLESLVER